MKRAAVFVLLVVAALYLGAVGYLYAFQRSFLFLPSGTLAAPDRAVLPGVAEVAIPMADGTTLAAWFRPPDPAKPTLVYFHGNAGNLSGREPRFARIVASGFGLLAPSYRGYPGSGGTPSEAALVADGLALFDWLRARVPGPIVLHGESLGTAIAAAVAAKREAAALILEAPFSATLDLAGERYPWVPVSWLMSDTFLTRERIGSVAEPVLVFHGEADLTTPVAHSRRLFERVRSVPKALEIMPGAGHAELWRRGLWGRTLRFLAEAGVISPAPPAPEPAGEAALPSLGSTGPKRP